MQRQQHFCCCPSPFYSTACVGSLLSVATFGCIFSIVINFGKIAFTQFIFQTHFLFLVRSNNRLGAYYQSKDYPANRHILLERIHFQQVDKTCITVSPIIAFIRLLLILYSKIIQILLECILCAEAGIRKITLLLFPLF